jgi:ABC-2 type transport system permease protein
MAARRVGGSPRSRLRDKLERIGQVMRKEFIQIRRDPRLARLIVIAPIIQLVVFGYAVSTDIRGTATFVVDQDRTQASRELVDAFTGSGYFKVVDRSDRPHDLIRALDHGRAVLGLQIPPGFSEDLARGDAAVQLLLDGTNSNLATVTQGYAERIVQTYGIAAQAGNIVPPLDLRARAWFNPDLKSRNYNVPAVVGLVLLLICLLLTSLAVVREREIGTLEQLQVSPLTAGELIAGKVIPFAVIGLIDLTLVSAVAILWFKTPFEGNLLLYFGATLFYLLCGLGIGLFISTLAGTQREAFMTSFLFFMPTILLSGFMFPVSSMPRLFQTLTLINPMRHYLVIVRGIFLKGAGLAVLWPEILILALMGIGILLFASYRFKRTGGGAD